MVWGLFLEKNNCVLRLISAKLSQDREHGVQGSPAWPHSHGTKNGSLGIYLQIIYMWLHILWLSNMAIQIPEILEVHEGMVHGYILDYRIPENI